MREWFTDAAYLAREQYRNSSNLDARSALHARFGTNPSGWHGWVLERIVPLAGRRILELGAGSGRLWRETIEQIPTNWEITLTDLSSGMLEDARAALGSHAERFRMLAANAESLPFGDQSFDTVIANHMLYHVSNMAGALSEIRRVLRPGGALCAATNGRDHMRELREWEKQLDLGPGLVTGPEELAFSLENGRQLLSQWFAEVRMERYDDTLVVGEVRPIINYLLSTATGKGLSPEAIVRCHQFLHELLGRQGLIRIRKDTGLFVAIRDKGLARHSHCPEEESEGTTTRLSEDPAR
jgi:ubiquinone/menaquinone biosynthesis C-methylase UbiE